jgi:CrcB protein
MAWRTALVGVRWQRWGSLRLPARLMAPTSGVSVLSAHLVEMGVDAVVRAVVPKLYARELAAIFAGGTVGALARAGLAQLAPQPPGTWPWTTFAVNIVGALLLGYFVTRLQERLPVSAYPRPLLGTGLCGALTTFSTMQIELLQMLDRGHLILAAGYAAASVAVGFVTVWLASFMVRQVRTLR